MPVIDAGEIDEVVAACCQVPPVRFPTAIAGHGPHSVALEAASPLEVNLLLLRSGTRRCLLVSFDLLYISGVLRRELLAEFEQRYGFAESDVLLFASHTHFAPPTDPALPDLGPFDEGYTLRVRDAVLEQVEQLVHARSGPYRVEVRTGDLAHSVNRRRPRFAPTYTRTWGISLARVTFAPYPKGTRNDTATVISLVDAASGAPIAVIWHYACHPVGQTPARVTSADYPGYVRNALRRLPGFEATLPVLFLQGFCGDVRPNMESLGESSGWNRLRGQFREAITGTPPMRVSAAGYSQWIDSLSQRIVQIAATAPSAVEEPGGFATTRAQVALRELFDGRLRLESMSICGLRIGRHLEILAFGAEPSAGWQARLQTALGAPAGIRLYAGYCGDVFGYLPLPEQVDEGGYEVAHFQSAFGMQGQFRKQSLLDRIVAATRLVRGQLLQAVS